MNFVQPIRDPAIIDEVKEFLRSESERNYMMFTFGINTGLRIQDILKLRVRDVQGEHLILIEMKTNKKKWIKINAALRRELKKYTEGMERDEYLFQSRQGENRPIKRDMAYKVMRKAAKRFGLADIGTHTMRKTFGYHMYQKTKDISLVQNLLNHSDKSITKRYIGMDQDMMDAAMDNFDL
ncbi:site-specific integrase [Paenibacillus sp. FSL K6-1318]|uniref:site-specific integrase n=1 Tax=Paenibacillus sp. FSL K6-1318 TaxID=2975291 RepID=UPI0030ED3A34